MERRSPSARPWVGFLVAVVLSGGLLTAFTGGRPADPDAGCPILRVVTAASFAPVLTQVAPTLRDGAGCMRLDVVVADGRGAVDTVAGTPADLWIPDDASWAGTAGGAELATGPDIGTVLAVSPFYLVTDPDTADRVTRAGGGWLGLAGLVTGTDDADRVTLAVRDPAGSGDGLVAVGAVGEAVWVDAGMDASAEALAAALPVTRIRAGDGPALPSTLAEVGIVPEYALLPALREDTGSDWEVLAPADHTAALRYSWFPTADAVADPVRAAALERLRGVLTAVAITPALAGAGLRAPDLGAAPGPPVEGVPVLDAPMFDVLGPHHVDHVFATWYAADRLADVLVAVDVSGSMAARAPESRRPLIDLVEEGFADLGALLPDGAELGLWEFGVRLDPPSDHRVLLPSAPLTPAHRAAVAQAAESLRARHTGTGLHDTVLAAYVAARDRHRDGVPNHVVVFTDGRDEADPGSLSMPELTAALREAADPARPVLLTVVAFGDQPEAERLAEALDPVGGYVDRLSAADEVGAVFIHVAAGGLHA